MNVVSPLGSRHWEEQQSVTMVAAFAKGGKGTQPLSCVLFNGSPL